MRPGPWPVTRREDTHTGGDALRGGPVPGVQPGQAPWSGRPAPLADALRSRPGRRLLLLVRPPGRAHPRPLAGVWLPPLQHAGGGRGERARGRGRAFSAPAFRAPWTAKSRGGRRRRRWSSAGVDEENPASLCAAAGTHTGDQPRHRLARVVWIEQELLVPPLARRVHCIADLHVGGIERRRQPPAPHAPLPLNVARDAYAPNRHDLTQRPCSSPQCSTHTAHGLCPRCRP